MNVNTNVMARRVSERSGSVRTVQSCGIPELGTEEGDVPALAPGATGLARTSGGTQNLG